MVVPSHHCYKVTMEFSSNGDEGSIETTFISDNLDDGLRRGAAWAEENLPDGARMNKVYVYRGGGIVFGWHHNLCGDKTPPIKQCVEQVILEFNTEEIIAVKGEPDRSH